MFKVIIAGSRHYSDYEVLAQRCDFLLSKISDRVEIVSGAARGADTLGERYASERGLQCTRFPADWNSNGKSAGPIRNIQMAEYADALIAFPIGKSVGTRHMISAARKRGLKVKYGTNPSTPSYN
jgi:hypothetical protein